MRIYIDCEFTDFARAELLSLGAVAEDGREFYAEVTDPARHRRSSEWVHEIVLPQFGLHPAALRVASDRELGAEFSRFLDASAVDIELVADYNGDLALALGALRAAGALNALGPRLRARNVAEHVHDCGLEEAWDATFKRLESDSGLLRHHALLDARALRDVADLALEFAR